MYIYINYHYTSKYYLHIICRNNLCFSISTTTNQHFLHVLPHCISSNFPYCPVASCTIFPSYNRSILPLSFYDPPPLPKPYTPPPPLAPPTQLSLALSSPPLLLPILYNLKAHLLRGGRALSLPPPSLPCLFFVDFGNIIFNF